MVIWLLGGGQLDAGGRRAGRRSAATPRPAAEPDPTPEILVVPDVRRQAYVFAKGILQDAGFAWKVEGSVRRLRRQHRRRPGPGARHPRRRQRRADRRVTLKPAARTHERGVPENSLRTAARQSCCLSDGRPRRRPRPPRPRPPRRRKRRRRPPHRGRAPQPPPPAAPQPQAEENGATASPTSSFPVLPKSPPTRSRCRSAPSAPGARRGRVASPAEEFVEPLALPARVDRHRRPASAGRTATRRSASSSGSTAAARRWGFGARSERVARRPSRTSRAREVSLARVAGGRAPGRLHPRRAARA